MDWIVCPGCGLRHSRRPDGACPRCKQSVDAASGPPGDAPSPAGLHPEAPPSAPSGAGLGRLAQSARGGQLKSARGIMLFVGIASVAVNAYFFFQAESAVQAEIDKEIRKLRPGFVVDNDKVQSIKNRAVRATRLVSGGGLVLGLVFVGCAVLVQRYPVPMTITALALYLGGTAIFGLIAPASLLNGIILKVFVVIGLFKAVQAAIAYQKDLGTLPGT